MKLIIKTIFSILAFAFAIWAAWIAIKIWQGELDPENYKTSFLLIVFLVLSCTYFLASAVQSGAEHIAGRETLQRKLLLYEELLQWTYEHNTENTTKEVYNLKIRLSMYGNVPVLRAFNHYLALQKEQASGAELEAACHQLLLSIRSDLGKSNVGIKNELRK